MGKLTSIVIGKFIAFDSSPLIYYIEQHPEYAPVTEDLLRLSLVRRPLPRGVASKGIAFSDDQAIISRCGEF